MVDTNTADAEVILLDILNLLPKNSSGVVLLPKISSSIGRNLARGIDKITIGKTRSRGRVISPDSQPLSDAQKTADIYTLLGELSNWLPCVLYHADLALRFSHISDNIGELIGLEKRAVMAPEFWAERVYPDDREMFSRMLANLRDYGSASLIHRLLDHRALPVWVCHRIKRVTTDGAEAIIGSLTAIGSDSRVQVPDPTAISRFVHKLGNHFQLLNLIANSLNKTLPDARELNALDDVIDRAIQLARAFSEYVQVPAWLPQVDLCDVVKSAVLTRKPFFNEKGVLLEDAINELLEDVTIPGDPFLLEAAIGHILQNALDASAVGQKVTLSGNVELSGGRVSVAHVWIKDFGSGINEADLSRVTVPFFTSKKDHDGLGLSLSLRFVQMHGGTLSIRSAVGKGTEVQISLPVVAAQKEAL